MLKPGEIVHIITRRLFEGDLRRHFVGDVLDCDNALLRVKGNLFVLDQGINEFVKMASVRERIFSLHDNGLIINVLPSGLDIDLLTYDDDHQGHLALTDGKEFRLEINEFSSRR